jgi:hypothetical protein
MFEAGVIKEPRLSLLAKACLNLLGRRYGAFEEVALAIQKNLAQARGPGVVSVPHTQLEQAAQGNPVKKLSRTLFLPGSNGLHVLT